MISSKLDANQIQKLSFDEANEAVRSIGIGGKLVPEIFDKIDLTYNGNGDIATVTYYSASNQVALLTLSYNGSNQLTSIVRT